MERYANNMARKIWYVVVVYVDVVGKDGKRLEDYDVDGLSLETEDYEEAKNFYTSLDLEKVLHDWLHPNEKNYCVKAEKEIAKWDNISDNFWDFEDVLEFVQTPWMRLKDEDKSITDLVALTEEERRYARV